MEWIMRIFNILGFLSGGKLINYSCATSPCARKLSEEARILRDIYVSNMRDITFKTKQ